MQGEVVQCWAVLDIADANSTDKMLTHTWETQHERFVHGLVVGIIFADAWLQLQVAILNLFKKVFYIKLLALSLNTLKQILW